MMNTLDEPVSETIVSLLQTTTALPEIPSFEDKDHE